MNRRLRVCFRVLLGCGASIFALTANSQLDQKPYQQWTADEVEKLLSNSPWAQTQPWVQMHELGPLYKPALSDPMATDASVTVRLRSALPMRQALARLRQLKSKYDKMSDRDRAAFDEKNKPLLECPACSDYYVITVDFPAILKAMTLPEAKLNVQIFDQAGQTRELVHFTQANATGEGIAFFFRRLNEKGEPLLTPQSKKLIVLLGPKFLNTTTSKTVTFDVSRMILNGNVAF